MKKKLALALVPVALALQSASSMAESPSQECEDIHSSALSIMESRQAAVPLREMRKKANSFGIGPLAHTLVITAYQHSQVSADTREAFSEEFAEKWRQICLKRNTGT